MTAPVRLSVHARQQIEERFAPADPVEWATRQFGIGFTIGYTRGGRVVLETPDALLVVAFDRGGRPPTVVTVMPDDWPVELVGRPYAWRGRDVPASPGALERLARRFRGGT